MTMRIAPLGDNNEMNVQIMKLMKLKRVMQEKDMLLLSSLPEFHLRRGVGPRKASEEAARSSTGPNLWRAHVE